LFWKKAGKAKPKMRAWEFSQQGDEGELTTNRAVPEVSSPEDVVIKIESAALNPVDVFMRDTGGFVREWPIVLGCDVAGTVHAVGEESGQTFCLGDRVWAYTSLGLKHSGGFAQYCKVPDALVGRVPLGMSFDSACTIGVGFFTAALLVTELGADVEDMKNCPVLVYGASSSVGQYAVQLAKHYEHKVIAVSCISFSVNFFRYLLAVSFY